MLWNNQPFCTLCKLSCDWFKKADWPIAGQDKENQTKDTGKKKGGVRGVARGMWRGSRRCKTEER